MSSSAESITDTRRPTTELRKSLRVTDGIALLIGITIGSGIFSTPSIIAQYYSSFDAIIFTWVVVAGFVLIGGLIYSELGTRFPVTGGEYVYLSKAFGPGVGFVFGWSQLIIIRTSPTAGLALIAADYVSYFVPMGSGGRLIVAIGFIAFVACLNYIGVERASLFQKVTTVVKVGGLVLFAVGGLVLLHGRDGHLGDSIPIAVAGSPASAVVAALMLIVFTHVGWDRVGYVAGEMKNAREVIPKSMMIGMGIIIAIYLSVNTIYHSALGMAAMRATATPAADVARMMVGPIGGGLIAVLAIVAAVGSINGTTMASSRVYYAMAHDGRFLRAFDFVHPRYQTPTRAIVAHAMWAVVILVVRGTFENIAAGMVFAVLIFYMLTTVALFKARRANDGQPDAFRLPGYPVLPAIYLIGIVGLLTVRVYFFPGQSMADLAYVASGIPVAYFWLRRKRQGGDASPPTIGTPAKA